MVRRTVLILLGAIIGAVAVNAVVAAVAVGAGASASSGPLQLPVYGALTALGVVGGWLGWRAVHRRSARPRAVLAVLVPAVTLVSFVPDLALLALRFIPDTGPAAVVALMVMHLVVVAFAVPAYTLATRVPAGSPQPATIR
ncbi:DUF6069 family protein [Dactylosporangium sp. CA-139066]|uniref:DUF6069 family protein n=1 Tax=Dactylosporangium sp. CA-139066 TaxID=3239930 RepID=UPI003D92D11F